MAAGLLARATLLVLLFSASVLASSGSLSVDVAVIGGGPAGYTLAALLASQHGVTVALIDPSPSSRWPNNYGAWLAEWEELSESLQMPELLTDCIAHTWSVTDTYFGGSHGRDPSERTRLQSAYVQIERDALKRVLERRLSGSGNATILAATLDATLDATALAPGEFGANLTHEPEGSTLMLSNGQRVRATVVVDATGGGSALVRRETPQQGGLWKEVQPGFQIAYGVLVVCEGGAGALLREAAAAGKEQMVEALLGAHVSPFVVADRRLHTALHLAPAPLRFTQRRAPAHSLRSLARTLSI